MNYITNIKVKFLTTRKNAEKMQQDQQRINKSILDYYSKDLLDIPNADKKY